MIKQNAASFGRRRFLFWGAAIDKFSSAASLCLRKSGRRPVLIRGSDYFAFDCFIARTSPSRRASKCVRRARSVVEIVRRTGAQSAITKL
jgi:hypothetical protein